jgi:NTP pyrophosphatase (non-canonical NTP hydrolase)
MTQDRKMTLSEYQAAAAEFRGNNPIPALGAMWAIGLCEEAGEVAGKIKKLHRDSGGWGSDVDRVAFRAALTKEMGDVLWYLSQLARDFGLDLGDVATANLAKLEARSAAGTLGGSGDDR